MNKGFLDDTFEKALEAGQSMAKSGAKQIKQTFNPLQMIKNSKEMGQSPEQEAQKMQEKMKKNGNSTPLDFDKLQKSYGKEDEAQAKIMAERLFRLVKAGEEKVIREGEQKKAEQQKQEIALSDQKKQQEAQARQQQQGAEMPQGKERKSILGGKKKKTGAPPATAEMKPSQGKQ